MKNNKSGLLYKFSTLSFIIILIIVTAGCASSKGSTASSSSKKSVSTASDNTLSGMQEIINSDGEIEYYDPITGSLITVSRGTGQSASTAPEKTVSPGSASSATNKSSTGTTSSGNINPADYTVPSANRMFDTVGLYIWDGNKSQHKFWKQCGIDTLIFCERGWYFNANNGSLDSHLANMTKAISDAKADGFTVYMILFSNIEQWKGPGDTEPTGVGVKFHPNDDTKLNERLSYLEKTIKATKQADGFTLLAGDPGGISDAMGTGGAQDFIKLAKKVKNLVKATAPAAQFNINTWAISYYKTPNSWFDYNFWMNETTLTKSIIAENGLIGADTGIELPTHDYYRPLALRPYSEQIKAGKISSYPLYPLKSDITALKGRGVKNIWAWPYFLMDEADDGDSGGGERTNLPQMETRYISQYLKQMQDIGMNGIIGNWSWNGYANKSLNTFAYGRMANDSTVTVDQVITEYAEFMATKETAPNLIKIIKYIENDSNWQKKLPADRRISNFTCDITSPAKALELLKTVQANTKSALAFPESPTKFMLKIKARLEWMTTRPGGV